MRWRLYERRGSPYTCCFCCHVRIGTMLLGSICLISQLMNIMMTLVFTGHRHADSHYNDFTTSNADVGIMKNDAGFVTIGSNAVNQTSWTTYTAGAQHHWAIDLVLNIGAAFFTVSLLYGVIKGRAKFLLPYFCLQVFDFCLSALIIIGFFTYEPKVKSWIASKKWFPLKDQLLSLNNGWLFMIAGCFAICIIWLKAYCISVVWSCYKYLISLRSTLPTHEATFIIESDCYVPPQDAGNAVSDHLHGEDAVTSLSNTEIMLPPKYEDVLQMPSGLAASDGSLASLPPAYNDVVHAESARCSN